MKRFDTNGVPFEYKTLPLSREEYAKIVSEINTDYFSTYINQPYALHFSLGDDDRYYAYYFENHGFDDYNIVERYLI